MEKHLFRLVSQSSSNTVVIYGSNEKKMKKKASLILITLVIVSMMIGLAYAQPKLEVSPSVVKPGEVIKITGQTTTRTTVVIEISNSRGSLESFNITAGSSSIYSVDYNVPQDSPVDVYTVKLLAGDDKSEASFIVSKMTSQQLANTIRKLVENARKQAESALIQARKHGNVIPQEIMAKYRQGIDKIENADNAIQNNNYVEAQQSLREALNLFKEVVEYSYGEDVTPPLDPEQDRLRAHEMIQELTTQYNKLDEAVHKLKQYGFNVDLIERNLNTLKTRLVEAKMLLDENKIPEALQSIEQTQQILQNRLTALRQMQAEITKRLAERYQTSLENRVQSYIDTFRLLQSVEPVQSTLALQELQSLQLKLADSSQLLDSGKTVIALKEMRNTEYRLKRLSDTVNGPVTSQLLNRIDELTANLQESTGTTTNQIEKEIDDTRNTLNDYLKNKRQSSSSGNTTLTPTG